MKRAARQRSRSGRRIAPRLKASGIYKTLHEKWDLYIPFLERGHQLLRPDGQMAFIIPDAYNAAKYAAKSHEFFLTQSRVERLDFCSEIPLFKAGVNNTILHFARSVPDDAHTPLRFRRWGEKAEDFEENVQDCRPHRRCSSEQRYSDPMGSRLRRYHNLRECWSRSATSAKAMCDSC